MSMVVIGTVFVDIKGYPYGKYIPAGRNSGNVEIVHGGVCRNIVEDIANVELRPTFISTVDETGTGEDVLRKLNNHKVNTKYMRKAPNSMGTWLAVFDHTGDVVGSISKRFDTTEIFNILKEQGDEIFNNADCILIEIDLDPEMVKYIFDLAEKYSKPVYAVVSNMTIAVERRDFLLRTSCFVCNLQEAEILFSESYAKKTIDEMVEVAHDKAMNAKINAFVITMGSKGAVYANKDGEYGFCPSQKVNVMDTTGAGDAFFAGVTIGLNYGKTLKEACEIGTKLATSVIITKDNVCPRFLPSEFGIDVEVE